MLDFIAVFDAYGAGFEYTTAGFTAARNDPAKGYTQHPKHNTLAPGQYTDDTQMSLALAELMLLHPNPQHWTPGLLAHAFLFTFKQDERDGYARGFQAFLERTDTAPEFLLNIRPMSNKSGGAMRAMVCGVLDTAEQVESAAILQASLTHATKIGMDSAAASALMTYYFYHHQGPKAGVGEFLDDRIRGYDFADGHEYRIQSTGWEHVAAAVGAVQEHDSASAILQAIVAQGGDTDTAAAIAAPAAYYCDEIADDLPQVLWDDLEDGDYGRTYLQGLSGRLEAKFPRSGAVESEYDLIGELFSQ